MEVYQVQQGKEVFLISLGCARNRVDSEVMLGSMLEKGWNIAPSAREADLIIINTCGFIGPAKQEAIDTILECSEYRSIRPDLKIVVTGCLAQRYKKQLAKGLPEVDFFVGTDEFHKIAEIIESHPEKGEVIAKRSNYLYNETLPRINTLSKGSAYVKVAEGCQHSCAFCIIPAIRGKLRSRSIQSIVKEVEQLTLQGVKEINLIAQDLAAFGRDKRDQKEDLLALLKGLTCLENLEWVRMLYLYPENISDEILDLIASEKKIVKYLDIPVQHASDSVLKRMKRAVDSKQLKEIFHKVRVKVPGIVIRTSVMVGFPGETESDFEELLNFIAEMKIDHLGCFTYSQEEGTVAARMPDQIDEEIKKHRYKKVMELQRIISKNKQKSFVGKVLPVLLEEISKKDSNLLLARLSCQAPEVDGVVYVERDSRLRLGEIYPVNIDSAGAYDFTAKGVFN